jgi:outer membrane protein TolC
MNMNDYEMALNKVREATAAFRLAQTAYRKREIGDIEFLEAKRIYDAAEREFDRAYDIEV